MLLNVNTFFALLPQRKKGLGLNPTGNVLISPLLDVIMIFVALKMYSNWGKYIQ